MFTGGVRGDGSVIRRVGSPNGHLYRTLEVDFMRKNTFIVLYHRFLYIYKHLYYVIVNFVIYVKCRQIYKRCRIPSSFEREDLKRTESGT